MNFDEYRTQTKTVGSERHDALFCFVIQVFRVFDRVVKRMFGTRMKQQEAGETA
jgi:hypothetical protein